MADRKISELTNLTGANLADDDEFPLVDTSADETKAITFGEFKTALDTATGFVRITGDTMTGALDVQSTITADGLTVDGTTTTDGLNLDAISDTIADTAVDIFVYDTRKDSDGGAWRKRTQHTSWYNETLNTATRGSRKEFPAVAVIVAESNQITIYDGDDPDLPMWTSFSGSHWLANSNMTSVVMKNGILAVGNSSYGLREFNFIKELALVRQTSNVYTAVSNPFNDHTSEPSTTSTSVGTIVNSAVNDVAMTVLPNAPIDAATGLPVPTIAVATDGGVSVIKDDGTVVDITTTYNTDNTSDYIDFTSDNRLYFCSRGKNYPIVADIPSSDVSSVQSSDVIFWPSAAGTTSGLDQVTVNNTNVTDIAAATNNSISFGGPKGIIYAQNVENISADKTAVFAQITSDFNTGYQNGDIKLATLSDTDDTNVTGAELVDNGNFNNGGDWSFGGGWNFANGQAEIDTTNNDLLSQDIGMVTGKTYTVSLVMTAYTDGVLDVRLGGNATQTATGTGVHTFTGVAGGSTLQIYAFTNATLSIDDISVRLAEEDRSVNGNGLQVFGTVTKNPVATGADLVAYSGFSASNYLQQPYNSDLDFGTGDFSLMGWAKPTGFVSNQHGHIFARQDPESANEWALQYLTTNNLAFRSAGATIADAGALTASVWSNVCVVRASGTLNMYINGVLKTSAAFTGNISNAADATPLRVGGRSSAYAGSWGGSLALLRISATAPSPEQIKKIYEDEKALFQENAQATLYGSSDAVTALAYDDSTELLHVGTSAGRSVFQGLRRVDNTTDAVGAAISASNGLVAED